MEFLTILIVFAVISRIIEALKGPKQRSGPGTRPPHPRRPMPRSLPHPREGEPSGSTDAREAAAEMIPDELWELLTGQKRERPLPSASPPASTQTRLPAPAGARAPVPSEDTSVVPPDEEEAAAEFVRSHRRDVEADIAATLEQQKTVLARRSPDRVRTVSLETEPLPEPIRHRRFHEKIDHAPTAPAPAPSAAARLGLRTAADLRRAFILQQVLGPPRGLEEESTDR